MAARPQGIDGGCESIATDRVVDDRGHRAIGYAFRLGPGVSHGHTPTRAGGNGKPATSTRVRNRLPQFPDGPPRDPVTM